MTRAPRPARRLARVRRALARLDTALLARLDERHGRPLGAPERPRAEMSVAERYLQRRTGR